MGGGIPPRRIDMLLTPNLGPDLIEFERVLHAKLRETTALPLVLLAPPQPRPRETIVQAPPAGGKTERL